MKKKKINLDQKLFLGKGTIAALNNDSQDDVVGGVASTACTSVISRCLCPQNPTTPGFTCRQTPLQTYCAPYQCY